MTFVGRRVLVVEDEFLASLTTIDLLESTGCEVVGPIVGLPAAVQVAQLELLDAAVLDINIGGEMIWPVAEELQRRGVPFLFVSAYSELSVIPVLFASVPRLPKPLEQNRFLCRLSTILDVRADEAVPFRK